MKNFNSNYYNFDFIKDIKTLNENTRTLSNIKKTLANLPAFKIINDSKMLDQINQQALNFSKEKNTFVVFGTGGSSLGAKALINILQGKEKKRILFHDNIDPINFYNSIDKLNIFELGFIIISKSGSTPETLSQLAALLELFDQKNSLDVFYKNTLIITEHGDNPLFKIAKENQCTTLKHDKKIGGRYSIFSNVAMLPAAIGGLNIKEIHAGAWDIINNNNESIKIAKFFRYQNIFSKLSNNVMMTYSDALFYFGKWYLQLWAESLGKNKKGITPLHAVGTSDQHSQLQLFLDGPRDKFFTFITTDHNNKGLKLHNDTMQKHKVNFLAGKTMGDLMQAEQQATIDTFKKKNFPIREIFVPVIDEFAIGQLMAFSIIETIATCIYFDVNPFNQPAVEEGKILTKKYLTN